MATFVDCPSCTRKLRIPDDMLGAPVRCPDCGNPFAAGAVPTPLKDDEVLPASPPPPEGAGVSEPVEPDVRNGAPTPTPDAAPPTTAYAANPPPAGGALVERPPAADDLRPCPHCGKLIRPEATRCRFCRSDLEGDEDARPWEEPYRSPVRRDCEPHRGTLVLVLGILSLVLGVLGLPLGIAAWILGHRDLKKINAGVMDPEGKGLTQAGWVCGIVGTILQSVMTLFCVAYFVFIIFMMTAMVGAAASRPTPTPTPPPGWPAPNGPAPGGPQQAPPGGPEAPPGGQLQQPEGPPPGQ